MAATIKISVSIQKTLFNQAETLAQRLNISRSQLCEMAITQLIRNYQSQLLEDEPVHAHENQPNRIVDRPQVINQGDIYWLLLEDPSGPEAGIRHPHVIVQDNALNYSRISTVVVCALTSNVMRANMPGNVLLDVAEANLPRHSVVEISKVSTVDKTQLGEYIGSLTEQRVNQILAGMRFLQRSFFAP